MRIIRVLALAVVLAFIGQVGVAAALLTCALLVGFSMPGYVVAFAFLYCAVPAVLLAWLAYGGVHLVARLWPRHRHLQRVVGRVDATLRRWLSRPVVGAAEPVGFSTSVQLAAPQAPRPRLLGVLVAVPLAFLNVPGWLALEMNLVEGPLAGAALFIVPGIVCGLMIGALVERLRG